MSNTETATIRRARCRVPRCEREAISRGLCRRCYQAAWELVHAETITWEQLENRGRVERTSSAKAWFLEVN